MDYSYYVRLIHEWLTNSGLSGQTNRLISSLGEVNTSVRLLADKLDGIDLQLQELLAYAGKFLHIGLFFCLLWFAMQFVQKRWYTS